MGNWTEKMGKDYMKRVKADAERGLKESNKRLKKAKEDSEEIQKHLDTVKKKLAEDINILSDTPHNTPIGGLFTHSQGIAKDLGIKFDSAKPRMELLSRVALEGMAQVLTFGARKYADNNWRSGFKWSRLIGAAMRHLTAILDGEDTDPESGLPHVDHLACCVMFLSEHQKKHLGTDDRYQGER